MNGISVIRQTNPMPIMVLSENADVAKRIQALECGADDFLRKPYNLDECAAKIGALVRRYTDLNYVTESHYVIVSHDGLLLDTGRRLLAVKGRK